MKMKFILLLLVFSMLLVGCRRAKVKDVERNPSGGVDITAELSESDVNAAIQEALASQVNPLLRDPEVDLQNGMMIINGEHDRRDGTGRVSGSLTVTLTVQDGALLAQVTSADIEGLELNDERIQAFNERLAEGLTRRANREDRQITMLSINISDTALEIKFNARRR
jgi:hypothetical protein